MHIGWNAQYDGVNWIYSYFAHYSSRDIFCEHDNEFDVQVTVHRDKFL